MSVELVKIQVEVPKELNDVRVALLGVIDSVVASEDPAKIILGNLEKLSEAIKNVQQVDDEYKEELKASLTLSGLMGGKILGAVLGKPKAADGEVVGELV